MLRKRKTENPKIVAVAREINKQFKKLKKGRDYLVSHARGQWQVLSRQYGWTEPTDVETYWKYALEGFEK